MLAQVDIKTIVDVGFVLFVAAACFKSLFSSSQADEKRTERWRTELRELETVLRGLIAEAAAASNNLDRSLLERKRELEALLKKIESCPKVTESKGAQPDKSTANSASGVDEAVSQGSGLQWQMGTQALSNAQDSRSPTSRNAKAVLKAALSRIEQNEQPSSDSLAADELFRKLNIMDPVAYKVARRLLESGKEIHVVARKLDLPLSEVRLLDRLLRQEQQKELQSQVSGQNTAMEDASFEQLAPEHVTVKQILKPLIRQIEVQRSKNSEQREFDIERDIEREVAMF